MRNRHKSAMSFLTSHHVPCSSLARSLTYNKVGSAGAAALSEALKTNRTLKTLKYAANRPSCPPHAQLTKEGQPLTPFAETLVFDCPRDTAIPPPRKPSPTQESTTDERLLLFISTSKNNMPLMFCLLLSPLLTPTCVPLHAASQTTTLLNRMTTSSTKPLGKDSRSKERKDIGRGRVE